MCKGATGEVPGVFEELLKTGVLELGEPRGG